MAGDTTSASRVGRDYADIPPISPAEARRAGLHCVDVAIRAGTDHEGTRELLVTLGLRQEADR